MSAIKKETVLRKNGIDKRRYYLLYTLVFVITAVMVNFAFIRRGLTYVCDVDAFTQHSVALGYYGEWLRDFFRTLFTEHRFEFRNFDFSIGMGADVVKALNYYAIGDPLNLVSVFFPERYTAQLYTFLAMLRYYLAGMAFSAYCFERKHSSFYGVLTSSLIYVFSTFGVLAGINHAFFINPMIYLPLIFIAVEKILKNKNPIYLALIVCVAEVSNFYFFYMLVFATVAYVFIRLFTLYGTGLKKMLAPLVRIGVSAVGGVLLGAVIFLPVALSFLSDSRVSVEHTYPLLYGLSYYFNLAVAMVYPNGFLPWTVVGSTAIFLYAVVALLLRRKRHTGLKIALFICVVGLCLPAFGGFSNGFSYACNRWCFIFTFVLAYATSLTWKDLFLLKNKVKSLIITALPMLYIGCCFYLPYTSRTKLKIYLVVFMAFTLLVFASSFIFRSAKIRRLLQCGMVMLNIASLALNGFVMTDSATAKFYTGSDVSAFASEEYAAVEEYTELKGDNSFYRYTSDYLEINDATRRNGYSTQYYWSLSDGYISDFQDSIYLNESFYQYYNGFDDSAVLNSLSCVKYYYDKQGRKGTVPFGFEKTETEGLYENRYALPVAYTYDSYIMRDELDTLETSAEKQQAFMKGVVLEEEPTALAKAEVSYKIERPEFELISDSDDITVENNTFTVKKSNASATMLIKAPVSGETYLSIRNLRFSATADPEIIFIKLDAVEKSGSGESKELKYYTPAYRFYAGKADYDICLGYSEDGYSRVTVSFGAKGSYSFDELCLVVQDMAYYTEGVRDLSEDVLENVEIGTDVIKGTVSVDESKLLCFAVPYSKGWKAYVDGVEQTVLKANIMHLGIELSAGDHEIELRYTTPEMKLGAIISFGGALLIFGMGMWYHITKKKKVDDFLQAN